MVWILMVAALLAGHEQTQREANQAACAKTERAQKKLDESIKELLRRAEKDAGLTSRIKKAQQAWVRFKEAQLGALYGSANPVGDYGSVWPLCACSAAEEMIEARRVQVQRMLTFVDGDLCGWRRP